MGNTPTRRGLDKDKFTVYKNAPRDESPRRLDFDEAFVLKRGDVLATAALRSYVSNALLMLDLDQAQKVGGHPGFLSSLDREHLQSLADDVSWLADQWEGIDNGKLPD